MSSPSSSRSARRPSARRLDSTNRPIASTRAVTPTTRARDLAEELRRLARELRDQPRGSRAQPRPPRLARGRHPLAARSSRTSSGPQQSPRSSRSLSRVGHGQRLATPRATRRRRRGPGRSEGTPARHVRGRARGAGRGAGRARRRRPTGGRQRPDGAVRCGSRHPVRQCSGSWRGPRPTRRGAPARPGAGRPQPRPGSDCERPTAGAS